MAYLTTPKTYFISPQPTLATQPQACFAAQQKPHSSMALGRKGVVPRPHSLGASGVAGRFQEQPKKLRLEAVAGGKLGLGAATEMLPGQLPKKVDRACTCMHRHACVRHACVYIYI